MTKHYLWLQLCIVLLYHDLAVRALSVSVVGKHDGPSKYFKREAESPDDRPKQDTVSCDPWEEFDGKECVCATNRTAHCSSAGGIVCDDKGKQYKSLCYSALEVCDKKAYNRQLISCGACDQLRLTDGGVVPTDRNLMVFRRIKDGRSGLDIKYKAENEDVLVYFDDMLDRWVIGQKNESGSYAGMMQETKAFYPEDSDGGMYVIHQNGTGEPQIVLDMNLRLECYNDTFQGHDIQKRFFFLILTIISVVAVATSTTLRIIQAQRGCLYYPSVCQMRNEVKNQLEPEVKRLKNNFMSTYGDIDYYKSTWEDIQPLVQDIRSKLITIKELDVELNNLISNVDILLIKFSNSDLPSDSLAEYKEWQDAANLNAAIATIAFQVELTITLASLPSLLAATVSTFTVAVAGFFAVVGIAFSVVDVVSSVIEERKVRDRLRSAKATLVKARDDLRKSFSKMESFQGILCKSAIEYLRQLSDKGRRFNRVFTNLYNWLRSVFGYSVNTCLYRKTHLNSLKTLKNSHLRPIKDYLSNQIQDLRQKIAEVKETDNFLRAVTHDLTTKKVDPQKAYDTAKRLHSRLASQLFPNFFQFLKIIAEKMLPTTNCYWGVNLYKIRTKQINPSNYKNADICKSPETSALHQLIQSEVKKMTIPCVILNLVKGYVFQTLTSVLRYIAQYVMPTSLCYWAFDLAPLRDSTGKVIDRYESANIVSSMFSVLGYFMNPTLTTTSLANARGFMCTGYKVCDGTWQNFILCAMTKGQQPVLSCPKAVVSSTCIPDTTRVQAC